MRGKYNARRTTVDGITFHSKAEAAAYSNRKLQEMSGDITGLELQPRYRLVVNGVHVCDYVADFRYTITATGTQVVEDVKGVKTAAYQIKKKLLKALYGISILETSGDDLPF
jgi:hypothetical protein